MLERIRARRIGGALTALGVAGALLASPAGAGPIAEVPPNDFRISEMGGTGNPNFDARTPDIAYNPTDDEYLVVWTADDNFGALVDDENEIFAQRLDGDGSAIGGRFRVSDMGPNGAPDFGARTPAVTYNPADGEYLVVWAGDDTTGGLVDNEFEIFGQRLETDGTPVGTNDFRISEMGGTGDAAFDARNPDVAFNPDLEEFLVVWSGDDDFGALVDDENEIFAQRLAADGTPAGGPNFRISAMGGVGDEAFDARDPAITYNAASDEYLVVWSGDDDSGGLVDDETEIFGQRLDGLATPVGTNDFRVSDVGGTGNTDHHAYNPAVIAEPSDGDYLVVWNGGDEGLATDESEIFSQRLSSTGSELGGNDVRISQAGGLGDVAHEAASPVAAYDAANDEYLVAWYGSDTQTHNEEFEIFVQRLAADGSEVGPDDLLVSDAGGIGNNDFVAQHPAVAFNLQANEYMLTWWGDDDVDGLVSGEFEIFGQRLAVPEDEEPVCVEDPAGKYTEPYYTVVTAKGKGHTFGNAPQTFDFTELLLPGERVIDGVGTSTGKGMSVVLDSGRVLSLGDAPQGIGQVDLAQLDADDEIIGIALTRDDEGAWVGTAHGKVLPLNAPDLGDWTTLDPPLVEELVDFKPSYPSDDAPADTAKGGFYAVDNSGGLFTSPLNTGGNGHLVNPFWFSLWDFPGLGDLRPQLRGPVTNVVVHQPDCDRDLAAVEMYAVDGGLFNAAKQPGEEGYTTFCGSGVNYYADVYGEDNIPAVGAVPDFVDGESWGRYCQILVRTDGFVLVNPGMDPHTQKWTPAQMGDVQGQLDADDEAVSIVAYTPPQQLLADFLGI